MQHLVNFVDLVVCISTAKYDKYPVIERIELFTYPRIEKEKPIKTIYI